MVCGKRDKLQKEVKSELGLSGQITEAKIQGERGAEKINGLGVGESWKQNQDQEAADKGREKQIRCKLGNREMVVIQKIDRGQYQHVLKGERNVL